MPSETTITVANTFEDLDKVASKVEAFCAGSEKLSQIEHRLVLVLEELLTNTISYGYDEGDTAPHQIDIQLSADTNALNVVYSDDGHPFDPTSKAPPDLSDDVGEREIGGLGIHLVMTIMEQVAYERTADGRNQLAMRMLLPA